MKSEAYDAIQNLVEEGSFNLPSFDRHDQLEIYCLKAALTPAQYWRQINLHRIDQYIERYSTDKTLKYLAASKLLALSQDISNPQATIDILLSLPVRLNSPDIIEKAIPLARRLSKGPQIPRPKMLQTISKRSRANPMQPIERVFDPGSGFI